MKKLIDNLAVVMVVLLFGVVIALVVRYNMIGEADSSDLVVVPETLQDKGRKKPSKKDYLSTLESYSDVDVKVDPTKENFKNTVKVVSEEVDNALETVLKSDEKKDYVKDLEQYEQKASPKSKKLEDVKPVEVENDDTIANELDSILGE